MEEENRSSLKQSSVVHETSRRAVLATRPKSSQLIATGEQRGGLPNISRHSPSFTSLFLAKPPTATVTLNIGHNVRDKTTQYYSIYYIHTEYF